MSTPPELEAYMSQEPYKSSGFWPRRTGFEKFLLCALGICGSAMVAGGTWYATTAGSGDGLQTGSAGHHERTINLRGKAMSDVCITPECLNVASRITVNMDQTADPCNDFYQFACGGWLNYTEIPSTEGRWGYFNTVMEKLDKIIIESLKAPMDPKDPQSVMNLKNLFKGCMDTEAIEAAGYDSFLPLVLNEATGGWPMVQEEWSEKKGFSAVAVAAENSRFFLTDDLILSYIFLDEHNSGRNIFYLDQPTLSLPAAFYLDPETFQDQIDAYKTYIGKVAQIMTEQTGDQIGQQEIMASVEEMLAFETKLAGILATSAERQNSTAAYNPYSVGELKKRWATLEWDVFFNQLFFDTSGFVTDDMETIVIEPGYFDRLTELLAETDTRVIADYLYWKRMAKMAGEGPSALVQAKNGFDMAINGLTEAPSRETQCVDKASSETTGFAYAVGYEYIRKAFDSDAKAQVEMLVEDVRASFKDLLTSSSWMDEDTMVLAAEKADAIISLIGYDETKSTPEGLDLFYEGAPKTDPATHYNNVLSIMNYVATKTYSMQEEIPNRNDWLTQPAIVNAFYSPNHNSITFPAGILQPPFFVKNAPWYVNYGGIGVVIGHEITHGFDDQGSQYDKDGNAIPWWSQEAVKNFQKEAECYISQYAQYHPPEITSDPSVTLDGELTQGENIADNGGLHEAFNAYKRAVQTMGEDQKLLELEQYSSEQMFFISHAQVWCEKATEAFRINQINMDPHSPGNLRPLGDMSNSADFQEAFQCPAGSKYVNEKPCDLW